MSSTLNRLKLFWFSPAGLCLRAVIFALLLNLTAINELALWNGDSPTNFNDPDEAIKLAFPLAVAKGQSDKFYYFEHDQTGTKLSSIITTPESVPVVLVGYLGAALNLNPAELGLLLDMFTSAICYVLFSHFFLLLARSRIIAETASLLLLAFPWLLSSVIKPLAVSPLHGRGQWITFTAFTHSSLPVLRGVSTQLSYVLFALFLYALAKALLQGNKAKYYAIAGALSGLCLYAYFFCWGVTLGLGLSLICIAWLRGIKPKKLWSFRTLAGQIAYFLFPHLLVALPGLVLLNNFIASSSDSNSIFSGRYFYFSLEMFLLFCIFLWPAFRHSSSIKQALAAVIVVAVLVTELILMQLQAVLGVLFQSIHFPVFFIHPLLEAAAALAILNTLDRRGDFRRIVNILCSVLFLLFTLRSTILPPISSEKKTPKGEYVEMLRYLKSETPREAVIAVIPGINAFNANETTFKLKPNASFISSVARRYVLYQEWQVHGERIVEAAKRELLLGLLFSGEMQLSRKCLDNFEGFTPIQYIQPWIERRIMRRQVCEAVHSILKEISACDLLQSFKVDFMLWEADFVFPKHSLISQTTSKVWESSERAYALLQIEQEILMQTYCQQN